MPTQTWRILLAFSLILGGVSLSTPSEACPNSYYNSPHRYRCDYSPVIFVGRVLESKAISSQMESGAEVFLYELTIYVDDEIKAITPLKDGLVTLYVVALPPESEISSSSLPYPYYNIPTAPEAGDAYLFFAKVFEGDALVLYENNGEHMALADSWLVDEVREFVSCNAYYPYY